VQQAVVDFLGKRACTDRGPTRIDARDLFGHSSESSSAPALKWSLLGDRPQNPTLKQPIPNTCEIAALEKEHSRPPMLECMQEVVRQNL
jgi:hypothetical protein